jgi:putative endonuclease
MTGSDTFLLSSDSNGANNPDMRDHNYWVYIMTNRSYTVLYTGVTNNLQSRVQQQKNGTADSFTKRYRVCLLVYCEWYADIRAAIAREKQIKGWSRAKKIALIESLNLSWHDLSETHEISALLPKVGG